MFYEVNLSNCDGANATIHIFDDGTIDRKGNYHAKVKRLAKLCMESENDPEMPEWAKMPMRKLEGLTSK